MLLRLRILIIRKLKSMFFNDFWNDIIDLIGVFAVGVIYRVRTP